MKAHVHYEAAFEGWLRRRELPYVAVNEQRQTRYLDAALKSFDFILYAPTGDNWLIDVKGRRWGPRRGTGRTAWENWATQADLDGLEQWQRVFGGGFRAMLLFVYWIDGGPAPPPELVHEFRGQHYLFVGVTLDDYRLHARVRSPKWGTVRVPLRDFARCVRPMDEWVSFGPAGVGVAASPDLQDSTSICRTSCGSGASSA